MLYFGPEWSQIRSDEPSLARPIGETAPIEAIPDPYNTEGSTRSARPARITSAPKTPSDTPSS